MAVEGKADQGLQRLVASQKFVSAGGATLLAFTSIGLALSIPGFLSNNAELMNIAIINLLLGSLIGVPLIYVGKAGINRAARLLSKSETQPALNNTEQPGNLLTGDPNTQSLRPPVRGSVTEHTTLNLPESRRKM